jgi:hypothetical protein
MDQFEEANTTRTEEPIDQTQSALTSADSHPGGRAEATAPRRSKVRVLQYSRSDMLI